MINLIVKKVILFSITLMLGMPLVYAQNFFRSSEYGVSIGASHYFGDLNTNYSLKRPFPLVGVFYRHQLNPYIAAKAALNFTRLSYDDKFNDNPFQHQRNLNFTTYLAELSLSGEFNFLWFSTGDPLHRFTPYLTAGIGVFYYNPYTTINDKKYFLRPLGTEGQNTEQYKDRKYTSFSVSFPIGVGVKYWIRPGLNFSAEIANRFTLTDYIDDVSTTYVGINNFVQDPMHPTPAAQLQDRSTTLNGQKLGREGKKRGDNSNNDQFIFAQITLSIQLKTYKCPTFLQGQWSTY